MKEKFGNLVIFDILTQYRIQTWRQADMVLIRVHT